MQFSDHSSEESHPILTWKSIMDWAQTHYRDRIFRKDEQIPVRPQLIYLVNQGAIRLVSETQMHQEDHCLDNITESDPGLTEEVETAFLGFVGVGKPFEVLSHHSFSFHAYAHVDYTQVAWLYWQDLENWPDFRQEIYNAFRDQHQRKLLWLSALGQRRTIDRLTSFLTLLIEEYGRENDQQYCLPYTLTHAQIGSAIGSTRVTVTRLMGKLRRQGIISVKNDNSICINTLLIDRNNLKL
ncbi:Crp/Fnr family transcriptional regulator [Waterburya agarophytonicola K14]|uniref:Crp/Fnr family transcriptional regulator n=1 Tax=Waterburya agarophytonicola KI4 TaxID=2874699 RepID=A0A964BRY6_9CYAN|nr:Crp/Fnr family transcriptional regulator [Waterburya agarophytonicola]MCC0178608.1 Crp/Fnr family transcriptional regulator [Waterburya agarophytonicola KI4]